MCDEIQLKLNLKFWSNRRIADRFLTGEVGRGFECPFTLYCDILLYDQVQCIVIYSFYAGTDTGHV